MVFILLYLWHVHTDEWNLTLLNTNRVEDVNFIKRIWPLLYSWYFFTKLLPRNLKPLNIGVYVHIHYMFHIVIIQDEMLRGNLIGESFLLNHVNEGSVESITTKMENLN